ncbi:phosphoglycerate mutase-like protein [Cristinia sonorae]|uniref:Phosphoglycerate mutase-like protein n=1 Tax=Cristinia sonorae TaxID=1940300 RepID=A0A8K0UUW9_9AGAR|nr:phosphoglycerate mutase-like protein [Cristinia sonorae]
MHAHLLSSHTTMSPRPLLTITFIRHGESTDNTKDIWAGWKDAPLSNHGMNQARACGESLSDIRFQTIWASPLQRAFSTAQAIYDVQPDPKPSFKTSPHLREQHFGIAEGKKWIVEWIPGMSLEDHIAQGLFPALHSRSEKFPEGESLDDLRTRATKAIEECVVPHIRDAARTASSGGHIALVSHGLCISEMLPALLRKDASGVEPKSSYRGLMNTGWARVTIEVKGWGGKEPLVFADNDIPPLIIKVTEFDRHEHLDKVKRQKGGIGSAAFDPKQKDIRAFFGGAKLGSQADVSASTKEEGRSESNVQDEVNVDIQ